MAVTITTIYDVLNILVVDIAATADGDITAVIPNPLGTAPLEVIITGLDLSAQLSLWTTIAITSTNIVLRKTTAVGSGAARNQVRVYIKKLLSTWPLLPIQV